MSDDSPWRAAKELLGPLLMAAIAAAVSLIAVAVVLAKPADGDADRERIAKEEATIEEWNRRPLVFVCVPRPNERVVIGRREPIGPDAQPDAEPLELILQMPDCDKHLGTPEDVDGTKR
jgi:hypothetical protein